MREFYARMIVGMQKLGSAWDLFNPGKTIEAAGFAPGQTRLVKMFPYKPMKLYKRTVEELSSVLQKTQLCLDCAKDANYSHEAIHGAPMTRKQMETGMVISSIMEPDIKAQAEQELAQESGAVAVTHESDKEEK